MRPAILLISVVLAACFDRPEEPAVETHREGDLTVVSRSLPAETTFAVVGLRPDAEHDDGAAGWRWDLSDRVVERRSDHVLREFRLTIRNETATVRELHARLDFVRGEDLVRRRTFDELVVPPFTERTWIGVMRMPPGDEPSPLVRVAPRSEPLELPSDDGGR